jgi:hypothetical protein
MKDSKPIDGMTPDEWIIYNKGYTRGLKIGEAIGEERIIQLLEEYPCESMPGHPITCECESRQNVIRIIKGKNK